MDTKGSKMERINADWGERSKEKNKKGIEEE